MPIRNKKVKSWEPDNSATILVMPQLPRKYHESIVNKLHGQEALDEYIRMRFREGYRCEACETKLNSKDIKGFPVYSYSYREKELKIKYIAAVCGLCWDGLNAERCCDLYREHTSKKPAIREKYLKTSMAHRKECNKYSQEYNWEVAKHCLSTISNCKFKSSDERRIDSHIMSIVSGNMREKIIQRYRVYFCHCSVGKATLAKWTVDIEDDELLSELKLISEKLQSKKNKSRNEWLTTPKVKLSFSIKKKRRYPSTETIRNKSKKYEKTLGFDEGEKERLNAIKELDPNALDRQAIK